MKVSGLTEAQQTTIAQVEAELVRVETELARARAELELLEVRAVLARVQEELSRERVESAQARNLLARMEAEKSQLQLDYDKSLKTNASLVQRVVTFTARIRELSSALQQSSSRSKAQETAVDRSEKQESASNPRTIFSGRKHRLDPGTNSDEEEYHHAPQTKCRHL